MLQFIVRHLDPVTSVQLLVTLDVVHGSDYRFAIEICFHSVAACIDQCTYKHTQTNILISTYKDSKIVEPLSHLLHHLDVPSCSMFLVTFTSAKRYYE